METYISHRAGRLEGQGGSVVVDGRELVGDVQRVPSFPVPKVLFCSMAALFGSTTYLRRLSSMVCRVCGSGNVAGMMNVRSEKFVVNPVLTAHLGTKFVPVHGPNGLPTRAVRRDCSGRCKGSAMRVRGSTLSRGSMMLLRSSLLTANKAVGTTYSLMGGLGPGGMCVGFVVRLGRLGNGTVFKSSMRVRSMLSL